MAPRRAPAARDGPGVAPPRPRPSWAKRDALARVLRGALAGARIKHRMKDNGIKMYDKQGFVLRIEAVINHPYQL